MLASLHPSPSLRNTGISRLQRVTYYVSSFHGPYIVERYVPTSYLLQTRPLSILGAHSPKAVHIRKNKFHGPKAIKTENGLHSAALRCLATKGGGREAEGGDGNTGRFSEPGIKGGHSNHNPVTVLRCICLLRHLSFLFVVKNATSTSCY